MTLIKSISGIRGTIGGKPGESLSPIDIVRFTSAFCKWALNQNYCESSNKQIIVGRDARITGNMITNLVTSTITAMGIDVLDLGLATTPTTEIAVSETKSLAGIIITASHNPANWNALKLLNNKGEFISNNDGIEIIRITEENDFNYAPYNSIGKYKYDNSWTEKHIDKIVNLTLVKPSIIKEKNYRIVVDGINSIGGIAVPLLLRKLGIKEIIELNCVPNGNFTHNPEPLPEHLQELSETVIKTKADLGISVDPDVDRLAIVCEDGSMFSEEYTLVAVADYVLKYQQGNCVSNLSSTQALKKIAQKHGVQHFSSAVGEVNVVEMMKKVNAVIGGEGNGGIIYPELHYGRDALVGIALFLSYLAEENITVSKLKSKYPFYHISKNKIEINENIDITKLFQKIKDKYSYAKFIETDGLKIEFEDEWIHLRKSNTEPIIRIYAESNSIEKSKKLAEEFINIIQKNLIN